MTSDNGAKRQTADTTTSCLSASLSGGKLTTGQREINDNELKLKTDSSADMNAVGLTVLQGKMSHESPAARSTKCLTTLLRLSYDNAKVTTD